MGGYSLRKEENNEMNMLKFVIVGHVDHGKSTLIGRLLFDTNSLPQDRIKEMLECGSKEKNFAHFLDCFQEEREKEMTVDTTQAPLKIKNKNFMLIDVPGHQALLKNMLTGASFADAAVLVVDVKKVLEEQTKRHLYILKFLGIVQLIVCINKMDLVLYKKENFIKSKKRIEVFLKELYFDVKKIIPISAKEGENLLISSSKMHWFKGPSLVETLYIFKKENRIFDFRFPVQDIYEVNGEEVVVGMIGSGAIRQGDIVNVSESSEKLKVKAIKVFKKTIRSAKSKESIGLVFEKLPKGLKRGQVLYKGKPIKLTNQIRARIFCFNTVNMQEELLLKCSTQEAPGKLRRINKVIDTATLKEHKDVMKLEPSEAGEVEIITERPLVTESFKDFPDLGRFIIEKDNDICAVGVFC
jgi:sulfate adenylyltransferase subunit 1 (EFTu-like GTPase family)